MGKARTRQYGVLVLFRGVGTGWVWMGVSSPLV